MLKTTAGFPMMHVPFNGSSPNLTALMGGQVQLAVDTVVASTPLIKAGKIKPIAVLSPQRLTLLPNVPTVAESGYPGFEALSWSGMSVPKGTPAPVVAKLEAAFKEVMSSPAIKQKMESNGFVVPVQGVKPYTDFVASELQRWVKVIKTAGIKPQ